MIYNAKHRYSDVAPRKMRPFAQLVRGKYAEEAIELLKFLPNRGARMIEAVIKSALGNAEDKGCRRVGCAICLIVRPRRIAAYEVVPDESVTEKRPAR